MPAEEGIQNDNKNLSESNFYSIIICIMGTRASLDKFFLLIVLLLVSLGFFLFTSAAMGLLEKGTEYFWVVFIKQVVLGLLGGLLMLFLFSKQNYQIYKKFAFYLFVLALLVSCLVFVPGIGIKHGGASRWLDIFGFSFQPAELLKIAFVIYFAAFLSAFKNKLANWKYSVLPIILMFFPLAALAFLQPDYGTLVIILIAAFGMLVAAEIKWKYLFFLISGFALALIPLILYKPYILNRLLIFIKPSTDLLGKGYQINQSLLAIGSGEFWGKGFGKSIQKFGILPEPMGDSIFAVTAEEWGFIGCLFLLSLFLIFTLRGMHIAKNSVDVFSRLLAVGIVILIVSQSFINMASMLGVFPMIGMPLIFVSQGGTALLFALAEVGILLNISKHRKKS